MKGFPTEIEPFSCAAREAALLAAYAMHSTDSRGRKYSEPAHPYRGPFQRDRDRILHCAAFRRLSQKTQVFTGHELGDYHRSRLTHTLEVNSVGRTLGRVLRLNEDLIEALSLQHDLGHPPFGHAGEELLDECLQGVGGFNHNRQALRIVEELESRYPGFPGLNLSYEVLESQHERIAKAQPELQPLLEAQIVDAADSVAYDSHDPDDALQVGLLKFDDLMGQAMWREAVRRVQQRYAALEPLELRRTTVHELIDWQVSDLCQETCRRISEYGFESVEEVRRAGRTVRPGSELAEMKAELESFLYDRVYRHPQLLTLRRRAQEKLRTMFNGYLARPDLLPPNFRNRIASDGLERTVGDYLAGMTDRFAQQEFERLFGSQAK